MPEIIEELVDKRLRHSAEYSLDNGRIQVEVQENMHYRSSGTWKKTDLYSLSGTVNGTITHDSEDIGISISGRTITLTTIAGTTSLTFEGIYGQSGTDTPVQIFKAPNNLKPDSIVGNRITWKLGTKANVYLDTTPISAQISIEILSNPLSGTPITADKVWLQFAKSGVAQQWTGISARSTKRERTDAFLEETSTTLKKGISTYGFTNSTIFPIIIDPIVSAISGSVKSFYKFIDSATYGQNTNPTTFWANHTDDYSTGGGHSSKSGGGGTNYYDGYNYRGYCRFDLTGQTGITSISDAKLKWRSSGNSETNTAGRQINIEQVSNYTNAEAASVVWAKAKVGTWTGTYTFTGSADTSERWIPTSNDSTLNTQVQNACGSEISFRLKPANEGNSAGNLTTYGTTTPTLVFTKNAAPDLGPSTVATVCTPSSSGLTVSPPLQYVGKGTVQYAGNTESKTLTAPSGVQTGDIVIAWCVNTSESDNGVFNNPPYAANVPAGWTRLYHHDEGVGSYASFRTSHTVWWAIYSPSLTYITMSTGGGYYPHPAGNTLAFRPAPYLGIKNPTIYGAQNWWAGTNPEAPSLTTTQRGSTLVAIFSQDYPASVTWTPPTNMIEVDDHVASGFTKEIVYQEGVTKGSTGAKTATSTSPTSVNVKIASMFVLEWLHTLSGTVGGTCTPSSTGLDVAKSDHIQIHTSHGTNSPAPTITLPPFSSGDILLLINSAHIHTTNDYASPINMGYMTINKPSGWTEIGSQQEGSWNIGGFEDQDGYRARAFYRIMQPGDSTSLYLANTGGGINNDWIFYSNISVSRFAGPIDPIDPIDCFSFGHGAEEDTLTVTHSQTTQYGNVKMVSMYLDSAGGAGTLTNEGGLTRLQTHASKYFATSAGTIVNPTTASYGYTADSANVAWITVLDVGLTPLQNRANVAITNTETLGVTKQIGKVLGI